MLIKCVLRARYCSVYWGGRGTVGTVPRQERWQQQQPAPTSRGRGHKAAMPDQCQLLATGRKGSHPEASPGGRDLHGSRVPATTITRGCCYHVPRFRSYTHSLHPILRWFGQVNTGYTTNHISAILFLSYFMPWWVN